MKKMIFATFATVLSICGAAAQGIEFETDAAKAKARAKSEAKPLFVVVLEHGNNLSEGMLEDVFTDEEIGAKYNEEFVPLLLWNDTEEGRTVMRDYGFGYTPAYLFLTPEGDLRHKEQGQRFSYDMLDMADKTLPQAARLAELCRAYVAGKIGREELAEYIAITSSLNLRSDGALIKWLETRPVDSLTFSFIAGEDVGVGNPAFNYLVARAGQFAETVGENRVNLYIYEKYFDYAGKNRDYVKTLRENDYTYADALGEHLSTNMRNVRDDASVQAQVDRLTDTYPITAPLVGLSLMRQVDNKHPEYDRYVDKIAAKAAAYVPEVGVQIARYIANNYLIVSSDVLSADNWVNRYLLWSGDPNFEYKMTKVVKQATGEWPCDDYGRQMPDIALKDLDGNTVKVSELYADGKFVLIDFWASWCGPCKAEIPHVIAAFDKVKDAPVKFVSISIDKNDDAWKESAAELAVPWLNLSANGTTLQREYKIRDIPRIMVLDPDGKLVADGLTGDTIEMQLGRLAEKYGWDWQRQ